MLVMLLYHQSARILLFLVLLSFNLIPIRFYHVELLTSCCLGYRMKWDKTVLYQIEIGV